MCDAELTKTAERYLIELPHFQQRFSWDCGISCVLMVLSEKHREHFMENFAVICKEEGFNKSTWTIDLSYLLKKYEIRHKFYTRTIGIHPGYKNQAFYNKILTKDESRVNHRFKTAKENGLVLRQGTLSINHILDHLRKGPVILLTNAWLLNCDYCMLHKISNEFRKCIPWPVSYQGHYVVLCGYDSNLKKIYYQNPTFRAGICRISIESLEKARKSYGTDEDIILIYK